MRFLLRFFVIGMLLLVGLGFGAAMFLDRGARIGVEKGVTFALNVPCTLDSVSIRPLDGSVALSELSIANPEGFSDQPLLGMEAASLQVSMSSLLDDIVEVQKLELTGIQLRLEGRGLKTNYGAILDNLARFESGEKQPKPDSEDSKPGKRFMIRELLIRNATVTADYALDSSLGSLGGTNATVTLPEIRLTDLGNGQSLTIEELSTKIFRALIEAAATSNTPGLSGDLAKDLQRSLSGLGGVDLGSEKGVKEILKGVGGLLK